MDSSSGVDQHHTAVVEILVRAGAEVDMRDLEGRTALYHAAGGGDACTEIVAILLRAGADPSSRDRSADTGMLSVLQVAVATRSPSVIRLLIDAGADLRSRDARGDTALDFAEVGRSSALRQVGIRVSVEPTTRRPLVAALAGGRPAIGVDLETSEPEHPVRALRARRGSVRVCHGASARVGASHSYPLVSIALQCRGSCG
jgi:hypothetical protein